MHFKFVRNGYQEKLDLKQLSLDDPLTLRLFQAGQTNGVFQFESTGIKMFYGVYIQLHLKMLLRSMLYIVQDRSEISMNLLRVNMESILLAIQKKFKTDPS